MDRDRIEGKGKQLKGEAKGAMGKMTGNDSQRIEGAGDKLAGKVQEGVGKVKDEIRAAKNPDRL